MRTNIQHFAKDHADVLMLQTGYVAVHESITTTVLICLNTAVSSVLTTQFSHDHNFEINHGIKSGYANCQNPST